MRPLLPLFLLRGAIVNRTDVVHTENYIFMFTIFTNNSWSYLPWFLVIVLLIAEGYSLSLLAGRLASAPRPDSTLPHHKTAKRRDGSHASAVRCGLCSAVRGGRVRAEMFLTCRTDHRFPLHDPLLVDPFSGHVYSFCCMSLRSSGCRVPGTYNLHDDRSTWVGSVLYRSCTSYRGRQVRTHSSR